MSSFSASPMTNPPPNTEAMEAVERAREIVAEVFDQKAFHLETRPVRNEAAIKLLREQANEFLCGKRDDSEQIRIALAALRSTAPTPSHAVSENAPEPPLLSERPQFAGADHAPGSAARNGSGAPTPADQGVVEELRQLERITEDDAANIYGRSADTILALQARITALVGQRDFYLKSWSEAQDAAAWLIGKIDALADQQCGPFAIRNAIANSPEAEALRALLTQHRCSEA